MRPIDIYIRGLRDGVEFCVKTMRDMPVSNQLVQASFNVAASALEKNLKDLLKEYQLDHSKNKLEN